jgi:hypothetical protein
MKTRAELEAESPEDFRNAAQTPEEEARDQRRWEAQRIANESLPDVPEDEDEDYEEEDDQDEVPDDE